MIRKWMHAWEYSLINRDTNRRVLPFEWGVEHVDNGARTGNPRQYLHEFVDKVLDQSDGFFTPSERTSYSFSQGVLSFPSPIQSAYDENNIALARFFPTDSAGRAVIVLPHWNAPAEAYVGLCRLLNLSGLTALRLSLPYHDNRKPSHLERSDYLVSPNIGLTIQACRQAVLETRLAANWLGEQGYQSLGIVGTSIGSCIAFLTFAHDARFHVGVFNHASSFFADVVWTGLTTQHVRKGIESRIHLDELRRLWSVISPQVYIHRLQRMRRKALVISAQYDLSFLPHLTEQFHQELERWKVPFDKATLPCGHYTSGKFPFNLLDGYYITSYVRKHLPKRKN